MEEEARQCRPVAKSGGGIHSRCPLPEFHFWSTPVLSFLGQGQGGWEGRGPHRSSRRERGREEGEAGPGLEGGARGDPGSSGLWGPLRLPHFSLAGAPRGWNCRPPGCVGPPRPVAVPGRAAARAPSLAARCALRSSRRRRVLPLSPRSSRSSHRNRGEGESERGRRERREGERGGRGRERERRRRRGKSECAAPSRGAAPEPAEPPRIAAPAPALAPAPAARVV